jgi:hypothetical protein
VPPPHPTARKDSMTSMGTDALKFISFLLFPLHYSNRDAIQSKLQRCLIADNCGLGERIAGVN